LIRGWAALSAAVVLAGSATLAGCSESHPAPTGPVSRANAGKAAFNEAKAIEKVYRAGYTQISLRPAADGVWRGSARRRGEAVPVDLSVTEDGPVVIEDPGR
jgi:hypothetical protein